MDPLAQRSKGQRCEPTGIYVVETTSRTPTLRGYKVVSGHPPSDQRGALIPHYKSRTERHLGTYHTEKVHNRYQ